jgi:hypothetical protein
VPSGRSVASASRSRPVLPVEPGHCGGSNLPHIPTTPASSARGGVRKGYPLGIVQSDLRRSLLRGVHPSTCGFILAVLARAGRKAAGFGRNPPFLPTGRHLPPTDRLLVAAVRGFASSSAPSVALATPENRRRYACSRVTVRAWSQEVGWLRLILDSRGRRGQNSLHPREPHIRSGFRLTCTSIVWRCAPRPPSQETWSFETYGVPSSLRPSIFGRKAEECTEERAEAPP